jgi:hypothetical protein
MVGQRRYGERVAGGQTALKARSTTELVGTQKMASRSWPVRDRRLSCLSTDLKDRAPLGARPRRPSDRSNPILLQSGRTTWITDAAHFHRGC